MGLVAAILVLCLVSSCASEFLDPYQEYDSKCLGEDVFHCDDGGCIKQSQYCDGHADCSDKSDEAFCPYHANAKKCKAENKWLCLDGSNCIQYDWICNNVTECKDASDEQNCHHTMINNSCGGFQCKNGTCISSLWLCDGVVDCIDLSDEYNETLCRSKNKYNTGYHYTQNCQYLTPNEKMYTCKDGSFCLNQERMCDGIKDCKDGSDEGHFCVDWHSMCNSINCTLPSKCYPDRNGGSCYCQHNQYYEVEKEKCTDIDECAQPEPYCSQYCVNMNTSFSCKCDSGYMEDGSLCFSNAASYPEGQLFYSTQNSIRYYSLRTKADVEVVSGIKSAHGVISDGTHLYWVETDEGHESIVRAMLNNITGTKQTLVALGLEDPGDLAIDWVADRLYFTDAEAGFIGVCYLDGSLCAKLNTKARHPKSVALHPQKGQLYWADWFNHSVIMRANMDGSNAAIFIDNLSQYVSSIVLDIPSERVYFVSDGIWSARMDGKGGHYLLKEHSLKPYTITFFENNIYWSDWSSNSIQQISKIPPFYRDVLLHKDSPIYGMHIYHPLLFPKVKSACDSSNCFEMCVLKGEGYSCLCGEGRLLVNGTHCKPILPSAQPEFLIVGGGSNFTRVRYNNLGNPEIRATRFNIKRVQAMAFNTKDRFLYVYDGVDRKINYIPMNEFSKGVTYLVDENVGNVVDMDYEYVSNALYYADATSRSIRVISLVDKHKADVYRFVDGKIPISLCVMSDYGRLLVAIEDINEQISIDSIGLDGNGRYRVISTGLQGPRIKLRYHHRMEQVFISDEGNGNIQFMHPNELRSFSSITNLIKDPANVEISIQTL